MGGECTSTIITHQPLVAPYGYYDPIGAMGLLFVLMLAAAFISYRCSLVKPKPSLVEFMQNHDATSVSWLLFETIYKPAYPFMGAFTFFVAVSSISYSSVSTPFIMTFALLGVFGILAHSLIRDYYQWMREARRLV